MLGKLIKHEFKASYKLMLISHIFILLLSLVIAIPLWLQTDVPEGSFDLTHQGLMALYAVLLYVIMVSVSLFGTQLYVAVRFYKNLFTDEGYLMYTLPTSPTQLLCSKIITGYAMILFNILIVGISAGIIYFPLITKTLRLSDVFLSGIESVITPSYILSNVGNYFLESLASLLLIYGCICIGQLYNKNRLFAAILAFAGCKFILGIVNIFMSFSSSFSIAYTINMSTTYPTQNTILSGMTIVSSLITICIFAPICYYIMNHKLNLV